MRRDFGKKEFLKKADREISSRMLQLDLLGDDGGPALEEVWDPRPWMKENLWIVRRGKGKGRFDEWTSIQEDLGEYFWDHRKNKKAIRIWLPKTRQRGVSTFVMGWNFSLIHRYPDRNAICIGHQKELTTDGPFRNLPYFYLYLPEEEKERRPIERSKVGRGSIRYTKPHHSTLVVYAGTSDAGHATMNNYVHITEAGLLGETLEEILSGVMPTIPFENTWDCSFVGEGTSAGRNAFFRRCMSAKYGEGQWEMIFIGLKKDENAWCELEPGEELVLPDHLIELQHEHEIPPEIMKFVKNKLPDFDGDLQRFHRQYPLTFDLAFQVSGGNLFSPKIITEMRNTALPVLMRGYPRFTTLETWDVEIVPDEYGPLWIWKQPEREERLDPAGFRIEVPRQYVIGMDVATGIEQDYTEIHVIPLEPPHEWVAMYRSNKIKVEDAGAVAWMLAAYYNMAYLGVERTGPGTSTLLVLEHGFPQKYPQMRGRYPNLYTETRMIKRSQETTDMIGFTTSGTSKEMALNRFAQAFHDRQIIIHAPWMLDQLEGYAWDAQRNTWIEHHKDPATRQPNDDAVAGGWLAYEMVRSYTENFFGQMEVVDG